MKGDLGWRWQQLNADQERGSGGGVSLVMVIATFAFLVIAGLVVDGGAKAAAADRASRLATEAARAGLQYANLDGTGFLQTDVTAEVSRYLTAAGVSGTTQIDGTRITVSVTISEPTKLLSLMGVDEITVTGVGTADGLYNPTD